MDRVVVGAIYLLMRSKSERSQKDFPLKHSGVKRLRFNFPQIDHRDVRQSSLINSEIEELFSAYGPAIEKVKTLAQEVASTIEAVSPFIQEHTASVCPSCVRVCCINKHSYHETQDIVLLYALGSQAPSYQEGLDDSAPCQFLGAQGCTLTRSLRPYRCNWYFCMPLLQRIHEAPGREYRTFVEMLAHLTDTRAKMLQEFASAVETIPALWEQWHS